jgi:uncharacterized caspase-like protein
MSVFSRATYNDLVFIFFSGHGRSHPLRKNDVYLLTWDFEPEKPRSGYAYRDLWNYIVDSNAKHVIAFIDACRSGTIGLTKGQVEGAFDQEAFGERLKQVPDTKIVFSSGESTQLSWEDLDKKLSVFTYYLLEGLEGKAEDINNPQFVDLGELARFVETKVLEHTMKAGNMAIQKPRLWAPSGIINYDFPVAIRKKRPN